MALSHVLDDAEIPALSAHFQRRHCDAETIRSYRRRYLAHPSRVLRIEDFLDADVARRTGSFLEEEAEYKTEYHLRSAPNVAPDVFERAPDEDRFFVAGTPERVRREHMLSPNLHAYLRLKEAMKARATLDFFARISGFKLDRISLIPRAMGAGAFVNYHIDDLGDRRLAFSLYLSRDWSPALGGNLVLKHGDGGLTEHSCTFNSMVIFDATLRTQHMVRPIADAAGDRIRVTLGGWMHESFEPQS